MKKTVFLSAWLLALCMVAMFLFAACGTKNATVTPATSDNTTQTTATPSDTNSGNDSAEKPDDKPTEEPEVDHWTFTADNLEEAKEIYDSFLYMTVYEDNMVVTVSSDDGLYLTETFDGEKDHIQYADGEEYYLWHDGDDYIYAAKEGNNKYYFNDKDTYDQYGMNFFFYVDVLSDLPTEGLTISLTSNVTGTHEEYDIIIDATLTLEYSYGDRSASVTAVKEHDRVVSLKAIYNDPDGSYFIEVKFDQFGTASVTLPDLTDWFNASAPRVASEWYVSGKIGGAQYDDIPMYFDYLTGYYKTDYMDVILGDNVTVKNKNDATVSYSQKIDADYLTGHEMIDFDPVEETIFFESDGEEI